MRRTGRFGLGMQDRLFPVWLYDMRELNHDNHQVTTGGRQTTLKTTHDDLDLLTEIGGVGCLLVSCCRALGEGRPWGNLQHIDPWRGDDPCVGRE